MAHFLDRLVAHNFLDEFYFKEMLELLPRAEMFKADNVFEYFNSAEKFRFGNDETGRVVQMDDFPSLAPPFPVFFVSGRDDSMFTACGTLFVARPIRDTQHDSFSHVLSHNNIWSSRLDLERKNVRWVLYALPVFQLGGRIFPPLICCVILLHESGQVYMGEQKDPGAMMFVIDQKMMPDITTWFKSLTGSMSWLHDDRSEYPLTMFADQLSGDDERVAEFYARVSAWVLMPSLLTISFLHCRNVEIIEHDPFVSRQMRRQSERRAQKTGYGLIKFRTLEIELVKRVMHEEGQVTSNGIGVALHLCRGHFKDFREGPGLFGKHNGLYWWDNQVRGSAKIGTVLKDYRLPRAEPSE